MANEMTSHGFDDFLNDLEKKITVNNRRKINKAGADVDWLFSKGKEGLHRPVTK